jgi:hypothetical protein
VEELKTMAMWKRIAVYGLFLGAGTLALQWFDYLQLARAHSGGIYLFLVAIAFLALGILVGARAIGGGPPTLPLKRSASGPRRGLEV